MPLTPLNVEQAQTIAKINKTYYKLIQPLLEPLSTIYQLKLNAVYNEQRSILTHIARAYFLEQKRDDEINKATGHLHRLLLDIFKLYALHYTDELDNFEKKYKNVNILSVDKSRFCSCYFRMKRIAESYLLMAKTREQRDTKLALSFFQKSYNYYNHLFTYYRKHERSLNAKYKLYILKKTVSLLVGIIAPIVTLAANAYTTGILRGLMEKYNIFPEILSFL